jgi:hypothetical protein
MPIQRKQQVLGAIETSEGEAATISGADAVLAYEPSLSDSVEQVESVPSGPSLSRADTPVGRQSRQLTFQTDWRGSGDTTSPPVDAPEWDRYVRGCGFRRVVLKAVTVGSPTGTGFQVGEILSSGSGANRGVIVGLFTGGTALAPRLTAAGVIVVAMIAGTFTAASVTGESSATTATASAVADYAGVCYQPTSRKLLNVTTGTWTGTAPAAVGEFVTVESGGVAVGSLQIITDNGSMEDIDAALVFGPVADGYTLRSAAGGTAVIGAPPTQIETPSLTLQHNLDGLQTQVLGGRGDFTLGAEVGQAAKFAWTFSGDIGPQVAALPLATGALTTIKPPRYVNAICAYGLGATMLRLPSKKFDYSNSGTVAPNLDANRPGGATGSNITDRDPQIVCTVDRVHTAFDWKAARDVGTNVRVAQLLGTTKGNIVGIVIPVGQVTEVADGEQDGIATNDVTVKARRILEAGDDEVYLVQL